MTNKFKVVSGNSDTPIKSTFDDYLTADLNARCYARAYGYAILICPRGVYSIVKQRVGTITIGKRPEIDYENTDTTGMNK